MIYDELRKLLEITVPANRISDLYQVCTSPKSSPVIWNFQETEWMKLLLRWAQEQNVVKACISKITECLIWDGVSPNLTPALKKLYRLKLIKPVSLAISGREPSVFGEFARSLISICLSTTEEDTIVFMNQLELTSREIQNKYENSAKSFGDLVVPESELVETYSMENLTIIVPYMVRHRIFEHYHGKCFYFYSPLYPAPSTSIIFKINNYKLKMKSLKQMCDDIYSNNQIDKDSDTVSQILKKADSLYSRLNEQIILLTKDFEVIKETDAANEVPDFLRESRQLIHDLGGQPNKIENKTSKADNSKEETLATKPAPPINNVVPVGKMPSISVFDSMEDED